MKLKYEDIKMNLRIVLCTDAFKEIQKMSEAKAIFLHFLSLKKSAWYTKYHLKELYGHYYLIELFTDNKYLLDVIKLTKFVIT